MRFSKEEMEEAFAEISKNEKPVLAFFGATVGAMPAIALYLLFYQMGGVLYIMLALPPLIVGLFARFVGRTYKAKYRISVGVVGAIVHLIGCYLLQLNSLVYVLTPVAFGVAMSVAKIKLERVHECAIEQVELGKINTNSALKPDS